MSESPVLSLSVIAGTALRAGWCLEPFFFPSALPGKRRSADCKGLGDSVCQTYFWHCNQRLFKFQTNQAVYLQDYHTGTSLQAVFPDGRFLKYPRHFWGLSTITKNAKDCKNEKTQLPTLVSMSLRVSGLSALPTSFLSSSTRPEGYLSFEFLTSSCESLHLTTGHAGGVDLLTVQYISVRLLERAPKDCYLFLSWCGQSDTAF